jgi:hypothetical protein
MRAWIAMFAALSLLSCNRENADKNAGQASARSSDTAPPAGTAPTRPPITVRANGADVLTITDSGSTIDIAAGGQKLHGETRDSGKRKYSIDGGSVSYEIKPNDEGGFKLRTADGKLRWKVKVTPEKIKISDNEENNNPFELKVRDGDRVKVVAPGEKELGNVRFDRAASKIEVENAAGQKQFEIATGTPSGAFGVLLLEAIPQQERAILVAEILSRGR